MTEEKEKRQKKAEAKKEEQAEPKPEKKEEAPKEKPEKKAETGEEPKKKEETQKEKPGKKEETPKKEKDDFRHRVRVLRVVIDGNLDVQRALMNIKGIGQHVSKVVTKGLSIDKKTKLGSLTDKEIEKIENAIKDLQNKVPSWMVNRQKDPYSGDNIHLVGPDLELMNREDINLQKKLKSYTGIRHSLGLPVRGQRTRTSFRKGTTIGVSRKKVVQLAKKKEGGKK